MCEIHEIYAIEYQICTVLYREIYVSMYEGDYGFGTLGSCSQGFCGGIVAVFIAVSFLEQVSSMSLRTRSVVVAVAEPGVKI